ncbi:MAG: hypothetical protein ACETWK_14460 [Candidatus Aminicenantaceae bacterium]
MKKKLHHFTVLLLALNLTCLSFGQDQTEEPITTFTQKPGLGFEYFSRTINWDEDEYNSKMKACIFSFNLGFEIQEGFYLAAILGYSFSNLDGLIFRQLPFSVELQVGKIGGFLLGGEIKKTLITLKDFEIGLIGQFVYFLGKTDTWSIEKLNVEASVDGKPTWMRVLAGPVLIYKGYDYFYPYIFANFNKLWGTFKMDEKVQQLSGSEDKKISGKGLYGISTGAIYEVTNSFSIKGEASFIPIQNGVDLGFVIKAVYSF